MNLKTLLFLLHRWLGIGMCLLFALWFASGLVMMYVEYPELTEAERLENLPDLNTAQILLSPLEASTLQRAGASVYGLVLTTILDRPAYQFVDLDGFITTVFADTGERLTNVGQSSALAAVAASGFNGSSQPTYDREIEMDQWTIAAELNHLRPLHRVSLNDPAGSVVYVSAKTGQIVMDTDRTERLWNWLGSTIHWIYPMQLRRHAALWNQVIIILSLIGIVSVLSGGIIGLMRIRKDSRNSHSRISPYTGWMQWHHLAGLISLVFIFTFIFSGLMSMGPWGIFNSATSPQPQIERYTGGATLRLTDLPLPDYASISDPIKEVRWHKIAGVTYPSLTRSDNSSQIILSMTPAPGLASNLTGLIEQAIPLLLPDATLLGLDVIDTPDNYYYSRHNNIRPFPVYRARFDDAESTWYHIDLTTGEIVNRITDASRRERWLFNGLHSLDFQLLLQHRPLWDLVVIILSLIGFGFSLTSVVIGWRRLVR